MKKIIIISAILALAFHVQAQRFNGAVVGGINISQIDGDGVAGYHKWGFTGGGKVAYEVYPKMDISMEMLFSQRGSKTSRENNPFIIDLTYLEVPLIYSLKDWYQEKERYHKARLDLGFSYGYLFNSTKNIEGFEEALENLNTHDLSYILGVGYRFDQHWGFGFRFTKSLIKIYKNETFENAGLQSYFITTRAEYYF